jgi:hypothetical protein
MKKRIYIETTVVSYLTARPGRDLIRAARSEITRQWWSVERQRFLLYISPFVIDEAAKGDAEAARLRLQALEGLPLLEPDDEVIKLAEDLIRQRVLPRRAATDAIHIALATVHKMDILLTWNCRHLANAETLGDVGKLIWSQGYIPPVICTPEELTGDWQ